MNFGLGGNIDHGNRYERAAEYIDLVKALWDSVEDDAILLNRETGYFADPHRIHRINHTGKYFKVRGPLNVPRPPQGHPIIVQAGSSDDGKSLAAKHADRCCAIPLRRVPTHRPVRVEVCRRPTLFGDRTQRV